MCSKQEDLWLLHDIKQVPPRFSGLNKRGRSVHTTVGKPENSMSPIIRGPLEGERANFTEPITPWSPCVAVQPLLMGSHHYQYGYGRKREEQPLQRAWAYVDRLYWTCWHEVHILCEFCSMFFEKKIQWDKGRFRLDFRIPSHRYHLCVWLVSVLHDRLTGLLRRIVVTLALSQWHVNYMWFPSEVCNLQYRHGICRDKERCWWWGCTTVGVATYWHMRVG